MKLLPRLAKVGNSSQIWRSCPNCHQQFDIGPALHRSGWSTLASSRFGVRCPICKMVLAAHQRRGFAAFWFVFVVVFTSVFAGIATKHLARVTMLPIAVAMAIFAVLMNRWKLRTLIELSVPPPGVALREVYPSAKEYAYLEGKAERGREFRIEASEAEDSRPEWICSNCKQPNPSSFDVCWKCNHRRPAG